MMGEIVRYQPAKQSEKVLYFKFFFFLIENNKYVARCPNGNLLRSHLILNRYILWSVINLGYGF